MMEAAPASEPRSQRAEQTVAFRGLLGVEERLRSTDDVLSMVLPLLRQTADAHDRGQVAPLAGVEDVSALRGRLFFENARCRPPEQERSKLASIEREETSAIAVVGRSRRIEDDREATVEDLSVVARGTEIERPVHVDGYVSWEHEVGHHDPVTDVYVLGLVLASVALDQDLGDRDALTRFVRARRDVRAFNERIHPVVARIVEGMTDPRRKKRLQDLRVIVHSLEHYREQSVSDEIDLEQIRGLLEKTRESRRALVCTRLRGRLFDLTRRNRLLYFHPSAQSLDLTEVSVPLVLDVNSIRADSLLTCNPSVVQELAGMEPIALGRFVRFEDYPFVVAALDKLRTTANRARAELGFSSLKLALCFLHWHDLKKAPEERIHSPLLLLPVELVRKKGVRDTYLLQATSDEAEVNPVLRHVLEQTYGLKLPEAVSLSEKGSIESLHRLLVERIRASEPAVEVERIEKPAIELVHARVRRRLDAFRKRAQISGRGVRAKEGIEYSYRRDNFQPLGLRLFTTRVMVSESPQATMFDAPRPRATMMAPEGVREVERELYQRKRGGDEGGPYRWGFDLTQVTLGNFDYQKMSLVRDYDTLLEREGENRAFDALFSADARPAPEAVEPPPPAEQYPVVAADATQMRTITHARKGTSFIVQGPPGTGKSQTITNLVADYVAQGKRVLFVCEKRAAIDVVFHRLRQLGLDRLTTRIHDSQADKKAFVASLKESYESWMREPADKAPSPRIAALDALTSTTADIDRFDALMTSKPEGSDQPLVSIVRRSLELRDVAMPVLSPRDAEKLPTHRALVSARAEIAHLARVLESLGEPAILARHPARLLHDDILASERPIDRVSRAIGEVLPIAERAAAVAPTGQPLSVVVQRAALSATILPLARANLLALLDRRARAIAH